MSDSTKNGKGPDEAPSFEPYVSPGEAPLEFTAKALFAGIVFGIVFGAANAYLGLRAGLTISTSIPIAVMTVAAFRGLAAAGVKSSILEANLAQTVGSASSSVASGVIFTLPALFLWNQDPELLQMTLLAMCGGLIGILFMIPLRRFLIAREHGRLPYPEGTACAEVLKASQAGGVGANNVFWGLGAGALLKGLTNWARVVPGDIHASIPFLPKGRLSCSVSAALFGVGYILGPRIGGIMVGGGLLSAVVIIPAIAMWGSGRAEPLYPETVKAISEMAPGEIWTRYVRYIGAGAVATGGFITLIRSIPTMVESFRIGAAELRQVGSHEKEATSRTDRDLPLGFVALALMGLAFVMGFVPQVFQALENFGGRITAAVLVIVFAFFFVTVSSRIVGLVGVTSNPTSGMTIASLLATSSLFLAFGWTGEAGRAGALTVGCVVAIAASIAGDTSQDLKTGYILGATPRRQQIGELLGVLTSATFVCLTILLLDQSIGFGTEELPAPQATLMKVVIEGVLEQSLPWTLVGIGVGIAILCELFRIPSLPFAVGVYLSVGTMLPVFLGGCLKWFLEKGVADPSEREERTQRGVLFGSGLVGGEGLLGVAIAAWAFATGSKPAGIGTGWAGAFAPGIGLLALAGLALAFRRLSQRRG